MKLRFMEGGGKAQLLKAIDKQCVDSRERYLYMTSPRA